MPWKLQKLAGQNPQGWWFRSMRRSIQETARETQVQHLQAANCLDEDWFYWQMTIPKESKFAIPNFFFHGFIKVMFYGADSGMILVATQVMLMTSQVNHCWTTQVEVQSLIVAATSAEWPSARNRVQTTFQRILQRFLPWFCLVFNLCLSIFTNVMRNFVYQPECVCLTLLVSVVLFNATTGMKNQDNRFGCQLIAGHS